MSKQNIIVAIVSIALFALAFYPVFMAGDLESASYTSKQNNLIAPRQEAQFSKWFFASIQSHNLETIKPYLDPKLVDAQFKEKFDAVANAIPYEMPKSIKFVALNNFKVNDISTTNVESEYEYSSKWLLANLALQKQGNGFLVLGFHVEPSSDSLEHLMKFRFWGQDIKHYAVFTAAVLVLLFDIYALALCIKMPLLKRKWLWIIFILIGFEKTDFNWVTGAFRYFINSQGLNIGFDLPVADVSQMLYQPFIVTITIPLGAIVFMYKRKKWLAQT